MGILKGVRLVVAPHPKHPLRRFLCHDPAEDPGRTDADLSGFCLIADRLA